jgi:putative methionine-R-sulfoxide reductase with GAF domain
MISIPKFTPTPLESEILIVGSVATKLYHTSCKAVEKQEVVVPIFPEPLKLPVVVTQLVFGVKLIAPEHKSFCEKQKQKLKKIKK